jgi:hypothetical protein
MRDEHRDTQGREETHGPRIRFIWIFWVFLTIGLVSLALEHRAHLYGALPYLLLLACPLMHLFMDHGHGGHGVHGGPRADARREPPRGD